MNYKVLYRKYRPNNFENIVGQDYIIRTLKNSVINDNISHAYIFSGPRGTGKTSTAKVFSKAINCLNPVEGSPCGNCEFCANFQENPDIIEIDAASNNGVDEIRSLIDNIKLTPSNGKYKVYVIDEVHMLTTSAFNALLLTLEEPPSHAIFILATTNIENVPITILSRCQRFDFQKITVDNIVKKLIEICKIENIKADEEALTEIAYLSEGGLRDALSLLDQLSKNNQTITLELVEKQIKTISQKSIIELLDLIESNNVEKFLDHISSYEKRAIDYKTLIKKIIDVSANRAKNIKKSNRYDRLTFIEYKKIIFELTECLSKININVNPYTIVEMALLNYFNMNENNSKIETYEDNSKNIEPEKIKENKEESIDNKSIDIRINNTFVNAQKQFLEEDKKLLNDFTTSSMCEGKTKAILVDSKVVAASDKNIILTCSSEHAALDANNMLQQIESSIEKYVNKGYKLVFLTEERWNKEKQQYILNIKKGNKYEYIAEKEPKEIEEINDVFDISKVEII